MEKAYEAKKFEDSIYSEWLNSGYFNPDNLPKTNGKTFSIVLPPPNVTGQLHIGHAAMLAYQDLMIRYHRMKGDKTLWLPGMDHAAIATQTVVDKKLKAQGIDRHEIGRKKFLKEVDKFVNESKTVIKKQLQKMGSSLDWSRERYTMDEGLTKSVQKVFIDMYNDDLIYRGKRVVNWCPHCQSTLADDEVEYKEQKSPFYYFKYGPVVIGTARPETKFSDKVIIVHPKDKRYKDIVGKEFEVEWIGGKIKAQVIADMSADMEMGTGAMTITPAHSMVDYELAQKYNLKIEEIINKEGKMTEAAGKLAGLPVKEAREKVVEILKSKGLVEKIDENYIHNLSVCYRCGTPIEPLPSEQWFVNVNKPIKKRKNKTLKQLASDIVKKGEIEIIPDRFNKTYFQWMDNLRDWCISRQIWFGHRIPVWYKGGEIKVQADNPGKDWIQDPDTLDTWFSSGLWTFSTLGGPEKTKDLEEFHPNSVMETGYDILFFWVARMILMTTYVLDEKPFDTVYLHGLVRDKQGRKMSKSLGNGIDPLEMIKDYGADALRLSMVIGSTPGNDVKLYDEKIAGYRNFVNKLWNISRYILTSVKEVKLIEKKPKAKTLTDKWILDELDKTISSITEKIEKFQFSPAGEELYDFTWNKLADWYIEISKIEKGKDEILLYILQKLLKLWHPFTPYITEVIWKNFNNDLLLIQKWPEVKKYKDNKKIQNEFKIIQNIIAEIRKFKNENKIDPGKFIDCLIISKKYDKLINEHAAIIEKLARVKQTPQEKTLNTELHLPNIKIYLKTEAKKSNDKEVVNLEGYIKSLKNKLGNEKFVDNAPAEIVKQEKEKLIEAEEMLEKISK
jgi:valyl-tRNA synthetase